MATLSSRYEAVIRATNIYFYMHMSEVLSVGHRGVKKYNTNAIVMFQLLLKDLPCWQLYCVATLRLLKFPDKIRTCSVVLQMPELYINTNTIIIIFMFVASRIIKREYLFFADGLKFFR